eukprot:9498092-Pyramimonas_sp.AAC.1
MRLGKHHHEWSTAATTSSSTSKPHEQQQRGATPSHTTNGNECASYHCLAGASDARRGRAL